MSRNSFACVPSSSHRPSDSELPRELEFASTTGGTCTYYQDLWGVPVVATVNNSTHNLEFLATHDYLSKKENVHFLSFAGRPGVTAPQTKWPLR